MELSDLLRRHAEATPNKTALFCGDASISYQELNDSSDWLARWFLNQGMLPGERVALHWQNSIEAVQLLFALCKAGIIAVTVNVRFKARGDRIYSRTLGSEIMF